LPPSVIGEGGLCTKHEWEEDWERRGVRAALTSPAPKDSIVVTKEGLWKIEIHQAPQYHILRHYICGDDLNFARSLFRCRNINPQGGKSKAAFWVSHDERFLIKEVKKNAEWDVLMTKCKALQWYADKVLFEKLPSVLAMVVGVFTVTVPVTKRKRNFVVHRNLRFDLLSTPHSVFDLKGIGKSRRAPTPAGHASTDAALLAERERSDDDEADDTPHVNEKAQTSSKPVLWDQNFREWTEGRPLCLVSRDLKYLEAAVWNDTMLLNNQNLIDYSLLLVAEERLGEQTLDLCTQTEPTRTLCLGIIDYLRPYTLVAEVESKAKMLGGRAEVTVMKPAFYSKRFKIAMGTFFVAGAPSAPPSGGGGSP